MNVDFAGLFSRYNKLLDRVQADDPTWKLPRIPTLEMFKQCWAEICKDPQLEGRWLVYLGPDGYERFRAECTEKAEQFLRQIGI